jgi:hypothetical protein
LKSDVPLPFGTRDLDFPSDICIIKRRENKALNLLSLYGLPFSAREHVGRFE